MQAGGLLLARRSQRLRRTSALQISTVLAQITLNWGMNIKEMIDHCKAGALLLQPTEAGASAEQGKSVIDTKKMILTK